MDGSDIDLGKVVGVGEVDKRVEHDSHPVGELGLAADITEVELSLGRVVCVAVCVQK